MVTDEFRLFVFLVMTNEIVRFRSTFSVGCRVRDKFALINAMSVDPLYLQHKHAQHAVDYRVRRPFRIDRCLFDWSLSFASVALGCCSQPTLPSFETLVHHSQLRNRRSSPLYSRSQSSNSVHKANSSPFARFSIVGWQKSSSAC